MTQRRLRYMADFRSKSYAGPVPNEVAFLPMEAVGDRGEYEHECVRSAKEVSEGYAYFERGDVVRAKVTPCFENGKGAHLHDLPARCGFGSTELLALAPRAETDGRFLYYVLASTEFVQGGVSSLYGAHGVKRVPESYFRDFRAWAPKLQHQRAIADYLDRETARIDSLIEKKQRHIGLLEERWLGSILQIAGGQLVPERRVQSGLAWLRTVPESWPVMPIRRLASVRRGASPRPIDDPKYFDDDGEYAWVRISDVSASEIYLQDTPQRLSDLGSSLSVKLDPGALFLSIAGSVGKPIISRIKCCIHDGFVYFDDLQMVPLYLFFLFASGQPYLGLGKLGTQLNLNTNTIGSICVPVPPAQVQNQLVSQLEIKHDSYRRAVAVLERQLRLLSERRQALITAAVTDQISIPGAA